MLPRNKPSYRADVLLVVVLVVIAAAVWWTLFSGTFLALPYNDSMDYASIGRNIARGEGITSSYLLPLGLEHHEFPQPNLWRAPLWPVALGITMALFGARDGIAAATGGLFYLGGLVLLYALARRLFGREVALGAGLVYLFNPWNLEFSMSGLTETLGIFVLLLWMFLFVAPGTRNPRGDLVLGAAGGLFYLARYNAVVFAPPVALGWILARRPEGRPAPILGRLALGAAVSASPWLLRNLFLFGNPMFSLQQYEIPMFSDVYPEYTLYLKPEKINVFQFIREQGDVWLDKITTNLEAFAADFWTAEFTGLPAAAVVLALASVLWLGREERRLHLVLVGSFLLQVIALALIHYIPRLFFVFFPFFVLFTLGGAYRLVEKFLPRTVVPGLVTLALAVALVLSQPVPWGEPNLELVKPLQLEKPLDDIAELVSRDEVVVSNNGHLVAWYSDRPAVKIPLHPRQLEDLEKNAPVGAVFITRHIHWNTPEADRAWVDIYSTKPRRFGDFRLEKVYETGCVLYLRENEEIGRGAEQ